MILPIGNRLRIKVVLKRALVTIGIRWYLLRRFVTGVVSKSLREI